MDKKGVSAGVIVALVVGLILLTAFVPVITDTSATARNFSYTCESNVAHPLYNTTLGLCTNVSGATYGNSSAGTDTLISGAEYTMLTLIPLFLVVAFGFFVAVKTGLFKR